jgi:inosine-uridine nucleoside N-ribohydrolase
MIKRFFKTIVIIILIVFVAYMIVTNIAFFRNLRVDYSEKVIIDTDSGNHLDDQFAIARSLTDPDMKIIGIISSHYNFHINAPDSSVMISQGINAKILEILNLTSIPHPMGAGKMLCCYGDPLPQPSDGAKFIIDNAHGLASGEKVKIIVMGAATNLASAIMMDSSIIPFLDCYVMGLKYDPMKRAWNKNEFNTRNDLDAMDIILNAKNLALTVMPATLAENIKFGREETFAKLSSRGDIWNYLMEQWDDKYPEYSEWIMRDVALIEAILHPKFATRRELYTPPENEHRKIKVYTKIKTEEIIRDYWKAVEKSTGE